MKAVVALVAFAAALTVIVLLAYVVWLAGRELIQRAGQIAERDERIARYRALAERAVTAEYPYPINRDDRSDPR